MSRRFLRRKREASRPEPIGLPEGLKKELDPIGLEALRIHESALFSAQGQFEQAKIWRALNMWLGVPAAVAAALAGSAILSGGSDSEILFFPASTVGGMLALIAAAFSATLTTVNASRRTNQAQSSANAYIQLQTEARQFVTVDLVTSDYAEARQGLESITTSRNELNKTSEAPGRTAYRRAKRVIYRDLGQDYAVDKER